MYNNTHSIINTSNVRYAATIVKSGTVPNFGNVENQSGKSTTFGSVEAMNQRSAFAFNSGQNHTGTTQKKVKYEIYYFLIYSFKQGKFKMNAFKNYLFCYEIKVGYNQEVNVYGYSGDGVDNLGFDEIPFSMNEGYDNEMGSTREDLRTPQNVNFPRADETIKLLRFEEPSSR